jgi:hypothetical protein
MRYAVIALFLTVYITGCSFSGQITHEEAENIALADAPNFKPENSNFEIYQSETFNDKGWKIIISSMEPGHEKPMPNIYYEISASGKVILVTDHAFGE